MLTIEFIAIQQVEELVTGAQKVSPFTPYVYGFLVLALIVMVLGLFSYIRHLVNKQFDINNKIIQENTKATQEYNILLKEKFKREDDVRDKMLQLMGKFEGTEENQIELMKKQNEVMVKMEAFLEANFKNK